jgi:hypothetical protein
MADTDVTPETTSSVAPSALRIYGRNPRRGNVGAVAASLKAHGQYRPIVANIGTHTGRRFEVLAGNHTLKAFRQLAQRHPEDERWNAILVHWVDVDEDQAARIVLADNRTAEKGRYDNKELASLLSDVSDDLTGLGYTAEDLDALLSVPEPVTVDIDDLSGDDDDEEPINNRGQSIISYSIVFDDEKQKKVWTDFIGWLKRKDPDSTMPQRLCDYIASVM